MKNNSHIIFRKRCGNLMLFLEEFAVLDIM
jgi:hypothetical protein